MRKRRNEYQKPIAKTTAALLGVLLLAVAAATTILGIQQQPAYAIVIGLCSQRAKEFAPGQLKVDSDFESQSAKLFAPGPEAKIEPEPGTEFNGASEFAPGHEAKIIGPE